MNPDATSRALIHGDNTYLWHPYSPVPTPVPPVPVVRAEGLYLYTPEGTVLIDGMSSWWAACHGHRPPQLVAAAHAQLDQLSHVMFGGITHPPAVRAARLLCALANNGSDHYQRVFFVDSGSVAVEVALKMAVQYQRARGNAARDRFLTWRGGYHGDTFATMSLCDPKTGMHSMWHRLQSQVFAPPPPGRGASDSQIADYLSVMESLVDDSIAAIVVEPIVQGAGGMRFHDPAIVAGLRGICDRHGIVLIADEIATGFGRTGELFATHAAGVHADILCVGKALTGGMVSLAATVTTERIAREISQNDGALMHGPTFMANPLACAVAHAAMSMIEEGKWRSQVSAIEENLRGGLMPLAHSPAVKEVRVLGAIGVVEMARTVAMERATRICVDTGVWLRPFGRLLYTMPPFIADKEAIAAICRTMAAIVADEERRYREDAGESGRD